MPRRRRKKKVCAYRKSKKNPSVYLKDELVRMAQKEDPSHNLTYYRKMTKQELCELLDIKWRSVSRPRKSRIRNELADWDERSCTARKSKAHPDAFTKAELIAVAIDLLDYTKAQATKYTKSELCYLLNEAGYEAPEYIEIPIKPAKRKKKAPAKKKRKPKKKKPVKKKRKVKKLKGDCVERSEINFRPHQLEIKDYLLNPKHRGAVAVHSTGSGKTLTAVLTSQCLLDKYPDWHVLVLALPSLQDNFRKEMVKYGISRDDPRYTIIGHQEFANRYTEGVMGCDSKTFLIIDEVHELRTIIDTQERVRKSHHDKIQKYKNKLEKYEISGKGRRPLPPAYPKAYVAVECARKAGKVLLLTATPIFNNPDDVENLVAMVEGRRVKGGTANKRKGDYARLSARSKLVPRLIDEKFGCIFHFYDNPEKSEDFPHLEEHVIREIMGPDVYKEYHEIEKDMSSRVGFNPDNPYKFLHGVRRAVNAIEPCLKCVWAINKIKDDAKKKRKVLLFSHWREEGVKIMMRMMDDEGIEYDEITGSTAIRKRQDVVERFNDPDGPSVLVVTKAGGTGLDLRGIRTVILLDKGWNVPEERQLIGRARRYKSHSHLPLKERTVDVYHLILIKPAKKLPGDDMLSADTILYEMSRDKEAISQDFEKDLRRVSIGVKEC